MNKGYRFKQASQQEINLYCLVGESVCAVQHLEDAISHSIVMKKVKPEFKKEADKLLDKHRSFTLGNAIKIAKQECLYPDSLQQKLKDFLSDRNWLIHRSIAQSREEWDLNISREKLMNRIKAITLKAQNLQQLIEKDMIKFSEDNGIDMTRVRDEIKKHYQI